MQIQPEYSQTEHCVINNPPPGPQSSTCITTGQNPTQTTCDPTCNPTTFPSHQEAGQAIGQQHRDCAQGEITADACTVTRVP